ncbi:hypothetical protein [Deinococcus sp.]|uniref:hypothetical protein n=1 Tax=Deinococcus sp. TaxID=47478 RepID=UPI003B5B59B1
MNIAQIIRQMVLKNSRSKTEIIASSKTIDPRFELFCPLLRIFLRVPDNRFISAQQRRTYEQVVITWFAFHRACRLLIHGDKGAGSDRHHLHGAG